MCAKPVSKEVEDGDEVDVVVVREEELNAGDVTESVWLCKMKAAKVRREKAPQ